MVIKRNNKNRIRFILSYLKPYYLTIISGQICTIGKAICSVLMPIILANVIDEVYYHKNSEYLLKGLILYGILSLGYLLIWLVSSYNWFYLQNRFVLDIRIKLFEKVLYGKASFLNNNKAGDLQTIINTDSDQLIDIVQNNLIDVFNNTLCYIASIIFIAFINKWIALYIFLLIPFSIISSEYLGRLAKKLNTDYRNEYGAYISRILEYINGMRTLHLLNSRHSAKRYVIKKLAKLIRIDIENKKVEYKVQKGSDTINLVLELGLYIISAKLIINGELTLGYFIAITEYVYSVKTNLRWLSNNYFDWQKRKVYLDKIIDLAETETEKDTNGLRESRIDAASGKGNICFDNVWFNHEEGKDILKGISFNIKQGENIAIVGTNGSGKTTITKLLLGIYNPVKGNILIDDMNILNLQHKSLRRFIGIVQQDITLFEGSIRYNLDFGRKNHSDADIWRALEKVDMAKVIDQLPNKLDTIIDKNAVDLSGGEKQRIMIARMYLRNPRILIFDEATSSLDVQSEQIVKKCFDDIRGERTTIVIAHRLSTIVNCDRIIVLKNGKVIAIDNHAKLLSYCEQYKELFKKQCHK